MKPEFDALSATMAREGTELRYRKSMTIFSQGGPSDAVFSIQKGKVKLAAVSKQNKEAVIAILNPGDLIGEACLIGQVVHIATASAMTDCAVARLARPSIMRLLSADHVFSGLALSYALGRNLRTESDLLDHLFNSSERRLARTLLLLANFGKEGPPESVVPKISQETLAGLVGTTRSRVSIFMNKFRKLGYIHYNSGGMEVHSSLLNVILHDK